MNNPHFPGRVSPKWRRLKEMLTNMAALKCQEFPHAFCDVTEVNSSDLGIVRK